MVERSSGGQLPPANTRSLDFWGERLGLASSYRQLPSIDRFGIYPHGQEHVVRLRIQQVYRLYEIDGQGRPIAGVFMLSNFKYNHIPSACII